MIGYQRFGRIRTTPRILVALCVLALAGASLHAPVAVADEPGTPPPRCAPTTQQGIDRSPSPTPTDTEGCTYPTGAQDVSPSIQVARDGTLFIARATRGVLRSTDDGATWTDIPVPDAAASAQTTGGHGYVHVDPRTDRVYYVTSLQVPACGGVSGAVVSWSDDLGESWTSHPFACDTYDWGKIVTGPAPEGNPYPSATYYFGVGSRPVSGQRVVYRSLDGGQSWERMSQLAAVSTEAGAGVIAPDGTVYFDYPEFFGFDPARVLDQTYPFDPADVCRQMIAVSEDFGAHWRQEPVPGSLTCLSLYGQQRVAVDREGTLYTVWVDDNDAQLYLSTSHDRAHTWSPPVNIMPIGATYSHTHANIIAAEAGHVLIAATMTSDPVNTRLAALSNRSDYSSYLIESFDADSPTPHLNTVDLDSPDDPSVRIGEDHNEANAYLGMGPEGQGWAVFSRHAPQLFTPGQLVAATIRRGQ
ncbi:sialidase family protein [Rhodococcoides yunnanense]|uniref:sialidase family protein n=1 Tax=Rhodococcoides yunnanense TaxID=278209 RepID=UPI00093214A3|nr:sialidase family protein [Rhodococcus yunnanensis]